MIKVTVDNHIDYNALETKGGVLELATDIGAIIAVIYEKIFNENLENPVLADTFKLIVQGIVGDDDCPIWKQMEEQGK